MELAASSRNSWLNWGRSSYTIPSSCGSGNGSRGRGRAGRSSNHIHTDIVVRPQACTRASNSRIPGIEGTERDAFSCGDSAALITADDQVECIARCSHATLVGSGGSNAVG